MKKIFKTVLALTVMGGAASYADAILISDDFSSSGITADSRFSLNDAGLGWRKNSTSLWTTSGGDLANAGTTAGVPAEGAVGQVVSVTTTDTSLTQLKVSFDYVVGTGSTLYLHLVGLTENGTPVSNEQLANTGAQNGNIQNQAETDYADMNLKDGSDVTGVANTGAAFTGSGTYSQTFDLTGYAWEADEAVVGGNSIASIVDFDLILAAFGSDVTETDGTGAMSVDNFKVEAIPEPAVLGLVVIFGGGILVSRRLSNF